MNFLGILWIIIIGFWVLNKAAGKQDNMSTPKSIYNTNKNATPEDGYKKVQAENIYDIKESEAVNKELKKATKESIENVRTLYENGIISKEEFREYKQKQRKWR